MTKSLLQIKTASQYSLPASRKIVFFGHMPVEALWEAKGTCAAPWNMTVKQALVTGQVFPHGLHQLKFFAASGTGQHLFRWGWAVFCFQVVHQSLLGGITKVTSLAPVTFSRPQDFLCRSNIILEAKTFPH